MRLRLSERRSPLTRFSRFYDDDFIERLIRRRASYDNTLLLRLVRPDDEFNVEYWSDVVDDLIALEANGAFDAFRAMA